MIVHWVFDQVIEVLLVTLRRRRADYKRDDLPTVY